ncbi:MAG: hypothetical protein ACI4BD_09150 [Paludibacteraceae bacterium]
MFVLIIFFLIVFLIAIFFIAYGMKIYSVRNDKEKQQEINNGRRMHFDPDTYDLARVLTCYSVSLIVCGLYFVLMDMTFFFPMLIGKEPTLTVLVVVIGGYFVITIAYLIALLTYARKKAEGEK